MVFVVDLLVGKTRLAPSDRCNKAIAVSISGWRDGRLVEVELTDGEMVSGGNIIRAKSTYQLDTYQEKNYLTRYDGTNRLGRFLGNGL